MILSFLALLEGSVFCVFCDEILLDCRHTIGIQMKGQEHFILRQGFNRTPRVH